MNDIELIKAEIERMHQEAVLAACGNDTDWLRSRIGTCVDILAFIDSLPGEIPPYCTGFKGDPDPPGISELEKAAARYERENRQSVLASVDIVNAFIEGAKWMEGRR